MIGDLLFIIYKTITTLKALISKFYLFCRFLCEDPLARIPTALADFMHEVAMAPMLQGPEWLFITTIIAILSAHGLCADLDPTTTSWFTHPFMQIMYGIVITFGLTYACEGHAELLIYGVFLLTSFIRLFNYIYLKSTFLQRLGISFALSACFMLGFSFVIDGTIYGGTFWWVMYSAHGLGQDAAAAYHGLYWFAWFHTVSTFGLPMAYYPIRGDRLGIWVEKNEELVYLAYAVLTVFSALSMVAFFNMPLTFLFMVPWHVFLLRKQAQVYSHLEGSWRK
jgi:hypothetical protein